MLKKKIISQYLAKTKNMQDKKLENGSGSKLADVADEKRSFTLSMAIPASIIDNAQSFELKTYLVSQIARAAAIYKVDEIVIVESRGKFTTSLAKSDPTIFFVRNLGKLTLLFDLN
jgi:hypothetical protein